MIVDRLIIVKNILILLARIISLLGNGLCPRLPDFSIQGQSELLVGFVQLVPPSFARSAAMFSGCIRVPESG